MIQTVVIGGKYAHVEDLRPGRNVGIEVTQENNLLIFSAFAFLFNFDVIDLAELEYLNNPRVGENGSIESQ